MSSSHGSSDSSSNNNSICSCESATYSVILPTYNEKDNIPIIISLLVKYFKQCKENFEILVVDDNSPDGTAKAYKQLQQIYPHEKLLLHERPGKLGLGSAYIEGLVRTSGDFIILMDSDLSHHPKFIPSFIRKQKDGNYDVVTGSRYISGGGVNGWDFRRILTSKVANFIAHLLLKPKASDLTGSFRLFKRAALERIVRDVQSKGYAFQMEVIVRAGSLRYSIGEVPITFVDRLYGTSKLGAGEIVQYLKGLFRLFWRI